MAWVATAIVGGALIGGTASYLGGKKSADASEQASRTQAASEQASLDYLKEREAIPQQFREGALKGLGGVYGMEGGEGSQQELIDRAKQSPLYSAIMGSRQAGEESILRSASATGGLRSGDVQSNLYDYNTQLQNSALLESYNQQLQGLQGMAGLPSYAPQIAQGTAQVGQTLAQGQVASGQATQQGYQGIGNNIIGATNLGIQAYGAGMFSDRRLKKNIKKIGEFKGFNLYKWTWNKVANSMGFNGESEGVLADEVVDTNPEYIGMKDGFLTVFYNKLGLSDKEVQHAS